MTEIVSDSHTRNYALAYFLYRFLVVYKVLQLDHIFVFYKLTKYDLYRIFVF